MLDLKDATMEEKITHFLLNELDDDQSKNVKDEINNNAEYQKLFDETKDLLNLIKSDKDMSHISLHLGEDRKKAIMAEVDGNKSSRVLDLFKHMKFTMAIAAALLLSVIFFPGMWDEGTSSQKLNDRNPSSNVMGVYSFKAVLPSGIYDLTFQDSKLSIDNITSSAGEDFFSKVNIMKGDIILDISGKNTHHFDANQWKSFFSELMNKKEIIIKIDRNGTSLNKRVLQ
ncbi:MAG: hypothetical protein COA79_25545 [Planctomycetota bacterium]|nr:MAG: hypothetical protein COA79_25545 [Planctomycetota bacterium]